MKKYFCLIAFAALTVALAPLSTAAAKEKAQQAKIEKQPEKAEKQAAPKEPAVPGDEYVIGTEDVIEVAVWKNDDLSRTVAVRPDGMITLPLIGEVKAAGQTPRQLRNEVITRLREYQDDPIASVIVQEVRSYRVFVIGEVMTPGTYVMTRKMTVLQAIALAGGFNPYASRNKIVLIRERPDKAAKPEKIKIRFDDIVDDEEETDGNIMLRAGDTIFVP